jgi:hypothetical protein
MSDTTITPPAGETAENSTIRQLRQAQADEKKRGDDLAEKLTTIERGKLADTERLTLELADRDKKLTDLGAKAGKLDRYEQAFQAQYQRELAAIPEAQRAAVERLSSTGDWNDRAEALQTAKGLLVPAAPVPPAGGTVTQPSGGTPPAPPAPGAMPAKPLTPAEMRNFSLGDAVKARGVQTTAPPERAPKE